MASQNENNKVAILLCSYNGERFLQEQLNSFKKQSFPHWELFVFDDQSTDNTCDVVKQFQSMVTQKVTLHNNEIKQGFCKNFLWALCNPSIENADFFALSDQDDIWEESKLSRAVEHLSSVSSDIPALYCSRTYTMDEEGVLLGTSTLFKKGPSFQNALVQCIAGGNTMVLNKAAKTLVAKASAGNHVISHDWWIYLLVSGAGGVIYYDPTPQVLYRQHRHNIMGANNNFRAQLRRLKLMLEGNLRQWVDENIFALNACKELLRTEQRETLISLTKTRQQPLLSRLRGFYKLGIYRQTILGQMGLLAAIIFNKV